jgi:hypothetical protein
MPELALTPRQILIGKVVAARLCDDDAATRRLLSSMVLPPQLKAVVERVGKEVPGFLARFLVAVDPGAALAMAWPRFVVWLLRDECLPAITIDKWKCREAIERVAALYDQEIPSGYAAYAACAAYAASAATYAARAARAASAAYAAYAATYAANYDNAASAAAWHRMANKLIEIVTDAR